MNALPNLSPAPPDAQKTTGTHNTAPSCLARCLAKKGGIDETLMDSNGQHMQEENDADSGEKKWTQKVITERAGFEPAEPGIPDSPV